MEEDQHEQDIESESAKGPGSPSRGKGKVKRLQSKTPETVSEMLELMILLVETYPNYLRDISDFQFDHPIGHGGFGEVWLAKDLRTGHQCAIKELFTEKLTGRAISNFIREISSMIVYRDRFLLPFFGFTIEPPYSLITQYEPNGCLSQYIYKNKRKQQLSPTHMQIIALSIIWGFIGIHRFRIVHRDIKAANILLDKKYLPMICDFGVSRFLPKNRRMTWRIGTICYMAPEVITTKNYGLECDVYSFGVILYEMVEGKNPWRVMKSEEIIPKIVHGERPEFTSEDYTPGMKELINDCWNQEPKQRPTLYKIFERLRDGSALFKDADLAKVRKYAEDLIKTESERQKSKVPLFHEPEKTVDIDSVLSRLKHHLELAKIAEAKGEDCLHLLKLGESEYIPRDISGDVQDSHELKPMNPDEPLTPEEILHDPSNPSFDSVLDYLSQNITHKQFGSFYKALFPYFRSESHPQIIIQIMESFVTLVKRDSVFFELFARVHFFNALPLADEESRDVSYRFVEQLFQTRPDLVKPNLSRALGSFLLKTPERALSLFAHYATSFEKVSDPYPMLDFMLSYSRVFLHDPSGATFIDILYYLLITYPGFFELRSEKIFSLFTIFTSSKARNTALSATKACCHFVKNGAKISFSAMCRNINDPVLNNITISLLLRTEQYPISRTFCRTIVNSLQQNPRAFHILYKIASQSYELAQLLAMNPKWMRIYHENAFKLYLILFTYPNLHPILSKALNFSEFMTKFISTGKPIIIESVCSILKRSQLNQQVFENLTKAGFFKVLVNVVSQGKDISISNSSNTLLDSLARKGYTPDYALFIPGLVEMLSQRNQLTTGAIAVLVTLSCHSRIASKLRQVPSLVSYYESLRQIPNYQKQAEIFLQNLSRAK